MSGFKECITVEASGTLVKSVRSTFYLTGPNSTQANDICDRHHEVTYYLNGAARTLDSNPSGCLPIVAGITHVGKYGGDYVDFPMNVTVDKGKPICTRSKNSDSGKDWTEYACQDM